MKAMRGSETSSFDRLRGPSTLLYLSLGPIVWAVHFAIVYGAHTLLCAVGGSGGFGARAATLVVIIATVVALILLSLPMLAPTMMRRRRPGSTEPASLSSFAQGVMALLALLSALGVAWAGAAALIVAPCISLR